MNFDLAPFWISLKTAFLATIITFVLGILVARWLTYSQVKGKGLIDAILVMPMVLPPTVVGFILLLCFGRNGPLGKLLGWFGVTVVFSWSATVIAATIVAFPLMYRTARGAFEQLNPDLMDAARTLGVSEWQIFWRIVLPLAWPGLLAGSLLAFARALGEFGATLMLAGNIPGKTQTIPLAIYFAVENGDLTQATFWMLVVIGISGGFILTLHYWSEAQNKILNRVGR